MIKWSRHRPSVIIDVDPSGSIDKSALKGIGCPYFVLSTMSSSPSDPSIFALNQLNILVEEVLGASKSFYKDQAKLYRKWANQRGSKYEHSLARYNFKAGWMEELAAFEDRDDITLAVRAYHVAYSSLAESKNGDKRTELAYLAVKIASGLARSGSPTEGHAYLLNHHRWANSNDQEKIADYISVASAFEPSNAGYYYLMATEVMRGAVESYDSDDIKRVMTMAFDAYQCKVYIRTLVRISLMSSMIFKSSENIELLANKLRQDGWEDLSSELLLRLPTVNNFECLWYLLGFINPSLMDPFAERLEELLTSRHELKFESPSNSIMVPCAFRFVHSKCTAGPVNFHINLSNMSPIILAIDRIQLQMVDQSEHELVIDEEVVPGSLFKYSSQLQITQTTKIHCIKVITDKLDLVYSSSALCTNNSLYEFGDSEMHWSRKFLTSLISYWDRSKTIQIVPKQCNITFEILHTPSIAGCPVSISFSSTDAEEKFDLVLLGCDHGECESLLTPLELPSTVEIVWSSAGKKTVLYEIRHPDGYVQQRNFIVDVNDPFMVEFKNIPYLEDINMMMLVAELTPCIDAELIKWEIWDINTGKSYAPVKTGPSSINAGEVFRLGFQVQRPDLSEPVLHISWSRGEISCLCKVAVPKSVFGPISGLVVMANVDSKRSTPGTRINCRWNIYNHTLQGINLVFSVSTEQENRQYVYNGPIRTEISLEANEELSIEGVLVALQSGPLALPQVSIDQPHTTISPDPIIIL